MEGELFFYPLSPRPGCSIQIVMQKKVERLWDSGNCTQQGRRSPVRCPLHSLLEETDFFLQRNFPVLEETLRNDCRAQIKGPLPPSLGGSLGPAPTKGVRTGKWGGGTAGAPAATSIWRRARERTTAKPKTTAHIPIPLTRLSYPPPSRSQAEHDSTTHQDDEDVSDDAKDEDDEVEAAEDGAEPGVAHQLLLAALRRLFLVEKGVAVAECGGAVVAETAVVAAWRRRRHFPCCCAGSRVEFRHGSGLIHLRTKKKRLINAEIFRCTTQLHICSPPAVHAWGLFCKGRRN